MEISITLAIAIIGCVISISTFVLNRKDKAVQSSKENHQELIEYQLKELKEDVKQILNKLDKYDKDIDDRIDKAMELHLQIYHKGEKQK